jgi:stage V sporulation protein AB
MIGKLLLVIVGLSGGLIVGSGTVALLTVLDLIPRLVQITKANRYIIYFQWSVVLGTLFATLFDFFSPMLGLQPVWLSIPGFFMGLFVGLLAAALTEVLNVIPILAKRMHMYEYLYLFIIAMAFGKIAGSLFHWLFFAK